MTYHHTHDAGKGLFTAQQDTQQAGAITYYQQDDHTLVIDHTEVEEAFRGGDDGKALVKKVAGYARENGLKIIPQCSYARKQFEEDTSYADVWQHEGE